MKILVINNLFPPRAVGGYERLVALVAQRLADRGHQVAVLTSDYAGGRPGRDEIPVERRLQLLVSDASIYEPFTGTAEERAARNEHNRRAIDEAIAREAPDAILVGNLYFLDRSALEALRGVAARTVFLLTDVWMIHFADDAFLQRWFRKTVFELEAGVPSLVPADPPGLWLEPVGSPEAWASRAAASPEVARRRRVEREMAQGRAVFQSPGTCHLCGPTVFRVEREGVATVTLPARARARSSCGRCGLDGSVRGALHALDALARPTSDEGILVAVVDSATRDTLARLLPRCRVVGPEALDGRGRHAHAVVVGAADEAERALGRVAAAVARGGTVVVGATGAGPHEAGGRDEPWWSLLEAARGAGLSRTRALAFWSRSHGYLGREHVAYVGEA